MGTIPVAFPSHYLHNKKNTTDRGSLESNHDMFGKILSNRQSWILPPGTEKACELENHHSLMGKSSFLASINGSLSIAMLDNQMVFPMNIPVFVCSIPLKITRKSLKSITRGYEFFWVASYNCLSAGNRSPISHWFNLHKHLTSSTFLLISSTCFLMLP